MNRGQAEVETVLLGDLEDDVTHPGQVGVASGASRRAYHQGNPGLNRGFEDHSAVSLDGGERELGARRGQQVRSEVGRACVAADQPRAEIDSAANRLLSEPRSKHARRREKRKRT